MPNDIDKKSRHHVVTILLHDYFHRHVFNKMIGEKQWSRFESRLERNVDEVCDLLDQFNIKATFKKANSISLEQVKKKGKTIHSFLLIFV